LLIALEQLSDVIEDEPTGKHRQAKHQKTAGEPMPLSVQGRGEEADGKSRH
jgi:hypothetical protein